MPSEASLPQLRMRWPTWYAPTTSGFWIQSTKCRVSTFLNVEFRAFCWPARTPSSMPSEASLPHAHLVCIYVWGFRGSHFFSVLSYAAGQRDSWRRHCYHCARDGLSGMRLCLGFQGFTLLLCAAGQHCVTAITVHDMTHLVRTYVWGFRRYNFVPM